MVRTDEHIVSTDDDHMSGNLPQPVEPWEICTSRLWPPSGSHHHFFMQTMENLGCKPSEIGSMLFQVSNPEI
nr:hypothetical protein [Tanacetum cinerariifolium]